MDIKCEIIKRTLVVCVNGDIDHHNAQSIKERVERDYSQKKCLNIIFDFANVKFIDSSAVGMIIGRYKTTCACGGALAIINIGEEAGRLLELAGIFKITRVYSNIDEAMTAFGEEVAG